MYIYKKDSKEKTVNEGVISIINKYHLEPKGFQSEEDLQLRMVTRFVNEAILCLQEGILNGPVSFVSVRRIIICYPNIIDTLNINHR